MLISQIPIANPLRLGQYRRLRFGSVSPSEQVLRAERDRLLQAAGQDSANDAGRYELCQGISKLTGHCAGVSNYLQQKYGGTVIRAVVALNLNGEPKEDVHYWYKAVDGKEYDLTSDQYGGDGFHTLEELPPRAIHQGAVTMTGVKILKQEAYACVAHSPWFDPLYQRMGFTNYQKHASKGPVLAKKDS